MTSPRRGGGCAVAPSGAARRPRRHPRPRRHGRLCRRRLGHPAAAVLSAAPKSYTAEVVLGIETTTSTRACGDGASTTWPASPSTTSAASWRALTGPIEQVPPMVSAVHHEGPPAPRARPRGHRVERRPAPSVSTSSSGATPDPCVLEIAVTCRPAPTPVLAADLGRLLGGGAHLGSAPDGFGGFTDTTPGLSTPSSCCPSGRGARSCPVTVDARHRPPGRPRRAPAPPPGDGPWRSWPPTVSSSPSTNGAAPPSQAGGGAVQGPRPARSGSVVVRAGHHPTSPIPVGRQHGRHHRRLHGVHLGHQP
jgi:hypothetical protein